jgi:hypothetical protein
LAVLLLLSGVAFLLFAKGDDTIFGFTSNLGCGFEELPPCRLCSLLGLRLLHGIERVKFGGQIGADSEPWRTSFRRDGEHRSEAMASGIPT